MPPSASRLVPAIALVAIAAIASGCGKTGPQAVGGGGPLRHLAPVEAQGAVSVTTRNTARVGGADTIVDAASVARVVYQGLTPGSRPQAIVLVDQANWPAALAASVLSSAPLGAPILYTQGNILPAVTLEAIEAMHPRGSSALGGAQIIRIDTEAPLPPRYKVQTLKSPTAAGVAASVEQLLSTVRGETPRQAIVMRTGTKLALEMPAAGLAAESGAPILFAEGPKLGPPAGTVLKTMHKPSIYVLGQSRLGRGALGVLAGLGRVTQVPGAGGEAANPAANSIAIARFTDGTFGWGVKEPGHGLVFANPGRPLDAPAAALLSASADYGPLLLLSGGGAIPAELSAYLGDIQPAYAGAPEFQPVRGVYNHGWLVGNEQAIPLVTQAELDALLEISPRQGASSEASVLQPE